MSAKQKKLQAQLDLVTKYSDLWASYFHFFSDEQDGIKDTPEYENSFRQVAQQLAALHYRLTESLYQDFDSGEAILKLLVDNVSLAKLKKMPDTEYDRMQVAWHEIFLKLNKTRGRLEHKLPPKRLEEIKAAQEQAQKTSMSMPTS